MSDSLIVASGVVVIDPGHGEGNRAPGVYDSGAVGIGGAEEADLTLRYALALEERFTQLGVETILTRREKDDPASLALRVAKAKQASAALLLSIHFNADALVGNSLADGAPKGFQVLYNARNLGAVKFASAITLAMTSHVVARGQQPIDRPDLYVLHYDPSVLLEVCFIDDPEDFALANDPSWMTSAMASVAEAVADTLKS